MKTIKNDQQQDSKTMADDLEPALKGMAGISESRTKSIGPGGLIGAEKRLVKRTQNKRTQDQRVVGSGKSVKNSTDAKKKMPKVSKPSEMIRKDEILNEAIEKHYRSEELKPYQAELIKLQHHLEMTGKKMVILFDGRDASGKGGTIRRIIRYMNTKRYRVVALGKPSEQQKTELHIKRYIEHFPHAGEIVLFDRSWYNRALVEPVMGFCTKAQYKRFMKKVISYEQNFLEDAGKTILIKLYFSVTKEEQERRFNRRKNDPLRQWKLSEVDLQAQELWDEFTQKKFMLLKNTHTKQSPWWVIRSDNKHLARRETMKLILNSVRYKGRGRKLDFTLDPTIVIPGNKELKEMKKQRKKYGRLVT
jgi:polyphosphate kinase 2